MTEQIYLVGHPTDKFFHDRRGEGISFNEIEKLPLALWDRSAGPRRLFDRAAGKADIVPKVLYEAGSAGVIKDLASQRLAYGVMSCSSVKQELVNGKLAALPIKDLTMTRAIAVNQDKAQSPIIAAMVKIISTEFETLKNQRIFDL